MSMDAQYMAACVCAKFDTIFVKVSLHRRVRWFAPAPPHLFILSLLHHLQPRQAGRHVSTRSTISAHRLVRTGVLECAE